MQNKHKNQTISICSITGKPVLMQWLPLTKKWECIHGLTAEDDQRLIDDFLLKIERSRMERLYSEGYPKYPEDSIAEEMIQNQLDNY